MRGGTVPQSLGAKCQLEGPEPFTPRRMTSFPQGQLNLGAPPHAAYDWKYKAHETPFTNLHVWEPSRGSHGDQKESNYRTAQRAEVALPLPGNNANVIQGKCDPRNFNGRHDSQEQDRNFSPIRPQAAPPRESTCHVTATPL